MSFHYIRSANLVLFLVGNLFKYPIQALLFRKGIASFLREVLWSLSDVLLALVDSLYQMEFPRKIFNRRNKIPITKKGNPSPFWMLLYFFFILWQINELYYEFMMVTTSHLMVIVVKIWLGIIPTQKKCRYCRMAPHCTGHLDIPLSAAFTHNKI